MALAHAHTARRLQFSASSDGLLTERQAEQPEPALDQSWRPLLPF